MTPLELVQLTRKLFPVWSPSDEEVGVFVSAYGRNDPDDVRKAIIEHKTDTPSAFPTLALILTKARSIAQDRVVSQPPAPIPPEEAREYETTNQWIDRVVGSMTKQEEDAIRAECPMMFACRGVLAVEIEKRRKHRR